MNSPFDDKWTRRYLDLAQHVASWSKDPSTKVGAVIVDPYTRNVVGMGYNGFPRGVDDSEDRYADRAIKYPRVVHAELNAILNAARPLHGHVMFIWPLFSCGECAKPVIQSGIRHIVAAKPNEERWQSQYDVAIEMYDQAGVVMELVEMHPRAAAMTINGTDVEVPWGEVQTYETLLQRAYMDFSVTWSMTAKKKGLEGMILSPGHGSFKADDGWVINIAHTGNA